MFSFNYFLLACFSGLVLIHFVPTSFGQQLNPYYCHPSACGNIKNISNPFRLRDDPQHCGDSMYELECKNNTTLVMYRYPQEYHVRAIYYNNYTLHLTDSTITGNDSCSFPRHSFSDMDPYQVAISSTQSIFFLSCPYPMNASRFVTTDHCFERDYTLNASSSSSSNRRRYSYIAVNDDPSDIWDNCTVDLQVWTSWRFKDSNNISLQEFHDSLLYGFELTWLSGPCSFDCPGGGQEFCRLGEGNRPMCYYWQFCHVNSPPYVMDENTGRSLRQKILCNSSLRLASFTSFAISVIGLGTRIIIGLPFILWILIYKLRRKHLSGFGVIEGFLQSHNNLTPIRYSYSEIKKMTKGFREKLGEGGYGSVYKGKLRSGQDVAVKVLTKPRGNGQDFINEVATIGRIHHVNVVKLVGYSAERSKCALVYDFMPSGSLEKYILKKERNNLLNWESMYKIAVGVARGIEYLHRGCDIQILHFDIKPHNILLDGNFTPKISDFGLAKFYSTEINTITLTAARGTIGYVAPELINRSIGSVSYKADVYSFGMLLLEMSGLKRDLVQNIDNSSQYFPYWIYSHFEKGKDIEIGNIDDDDDDDDDSDGARKITRKMAIVGLWCIRMSPDDRPSMSKVVEMLEGEVESLEIPPRPSDFIPHVALSEDQTWETYSTDSVSLWHEENSRNQ